MSNLAFDLIIAGTCDDPPPPSCSTGKSWPHFRPSAVDFCGSRLAIGGAPGPNLAAAMTMYREMDVSFSPDPAD
jgi:hypothetical protein